MLSWRKPTLGAWFLSFGVKRRGRSIPLSYQLFWTLTLRDWRISLAEVQVWLAEIARPPAVACWFSSLLTEDERERARCFYFERDRLRFIVARGLLRPPWLLSCSGAGGAAYSYSHNGRKALACPSV